MAAHSQTTVDGADKIRDVSTSDDVLDAINTLVDHILDTTDTEEAREAARSYLDALATTGINSYSKQNILGLWSQMEARDREFTAGHFAGYNTWMDEHGRHVKQGETGFTVIAPNTGPACPQCGNAPAYHTRERIECERSGSHPDEWDFDPYDEWSKGVYYFTTATTFAYEQTAPIDDADEDETLRVEDPRENSADAEELIGNLTTVAESGGIESVGEVEVLMRDENIAVNGHGRSTDGKVVVAKQKNTAQMAKTLIHELAHEALHHTDDDPGRPVEETEAEAVAYAVSRVLGLDPGDHSHQYVGVWREQAKIAAEEARQSADDEGDTGREAAREVIKTRMGHVKTVAQKIVEAVQANE